ncbi:MAG: ribonuclease HII [Alphaproteobacteria bacterium]|nr:MAG: ribonuclease HII [Alphaproteobacteria bacterium]
MQDFDKNYNTPILGIDEAGRGPLCGPVVSACVWWHEFPNEDLGINDSKKLTQPRRQNAFNQLMNSTGKNQLSVGIGIASAFEIDEMNILNATKLSMYRAFKRCKKPEKFLALLDGNQPVSTINPHETVIKGDQKSFSIATASIIAKVIRDEIMEKIHILYPEYHLDQHKGYGTKLHKEKIQEFGFCPYHRKSFKI